jgi:hypothetical protein
MSVLMLFSKGDKMSHEVKYLLWVATAYIAARIINNYITVTKLIGPGA